MAVNQSNSNGRDASIQALSFTKAERLLSAGDYARVFDRAEIKASHPTLLILARGNSLAYPRLGLVVSKKNLRLAVQRNKLKRLIRESFRRTKHHLPPIDAIVLARRGTDALNSKEISTILDELWTRVAKKARKTLSTDR